MKNSKATGVDDIPIEEWMKECMIFCHLMNKLWRQENTSTKEENRLIVPRNNIEIVKLSIKRKGE